MIELGLVNAPAIKKIPLPFSFTDITATVNLNTLVETSIIPIGFEGNADATVTGNDAAIRVNNAGAWGSTARLGPGDLLNLRMTASAAYDTTLTANVTIYGVSDTWSLKTCTNPGMAFANTDGALLSTFYYTSSVNQSNANQHVNITGGSGFVSTDNVNWSGSANIVPSGTVYLKQESANTGLTTKTLTVEVAANTYTWNVTTVAGVVSPNLEFAFPIGTGYNQNWGNTYTMALISRANPISNSVIWYKGFDNSASNATLQFVVTSNAEYCRISNDIFGASGWANSCNVAPGNILWINIVSSNTANTPVRATVSAGGYNFIVDVTTTHPDPQFTFTSYSFSIPPNTPTWGTTNDQHPTNNTGYDMMIYSNNGITEVSNDGLAWGSSTFLPNGAQLWTRVTSGGTADFYSNTGYFWIWQNQFSITESGGH